MRLSYVSYHRKSINSALSSSSQESVNADNNGEFLQPWQQVLDEDNASNDMANLIM